MSRVFLLTFLAITFGLGVAGGAEAEPLRGEVEAAWATAQIAIVHPDATFFPGESLEITFSGVVDINPTPRKEKKCTWFGLKCKTIRWVDHHFTPAQALSPRVILKPVDGGAPELVAVARNGLASIRIEGGTSQLRRAYELRGIVESQSVKVNHSTSLQSLQIEVAVDATQRLRLFERWLEQDNPRAADIRDSGVINSHLRVHNARLASLIRVHADRVLDGLPAQSGKREKIALLKLAIELAPGDGESYEALSRFYLEIGSSDLAEKTTLDRIGQLQAGLSSSSSSSTRSELARSFVVLGEASLRNTAGIDGVDLHAATAAFAKAGRYFEEAGDRAGLAAALFEQAKTLRRIRTPEAIEQAIELFSRARTLMPQRLAGERLSSSPNGLFHLIGSVSPGWTEISLTDPSRQAVHRAIPGSIQGILSVDWANDRLLVRTNSTLYWESTKTGESVELGTYPFEYAVSGNGNVVGARERKSAVAIYDTVVTGNRRRFVYSNPTGERCEVTDDPESFIRQQIIVPAASSDVIANICGGSIRIDRVGNNGLEPVREIRLPSAEFVVSGALSPNGIHFAAVVMKNAKRLPNGRFSNPTPPRIMLWSVAGGSARTVYTSPPFVNSMPFPADGEEIEERDFYAPSFGGQPTSLSFTPDSANLLVTTRVSTAWLYPIAGGQRIDISLPWQPGLGSIGHTWIAKDTAILVSAQGKALSLDYPSRAVSSLPNGLPPAISVVYMASDGHINAAGPSTLVSATVFQETPQGNLKTHGLAVELSGIDGRLPLNLLNGGRYLLSGNLTSGELVLFDIEGKQHEVMAQGISPPGFLRFSPDRLGTWAVPTNGDHEWTLQRLSGNWLTSLEHFKGKALDWQSDGIAAAEAFQAQISEDVKRWLDRPASPRPNQTGPYSPPTDDELRAELDRPDGLSIGWIPTVAGLEAIGTPAAPVAIATPFVDRAGERVPIRVPGRSERRILNWINLQSPDLPQPEALSGKIHPLEIIGEPPHFLGVHMEWAANAPPKREWHLDGGGGRLLKLGSADKPERLTVRTSRNGSRSLVLWQLMDASPGVMPSLRARIVKFPGQGPPKLLSCNSCDRADTSSLAEIASHLLGRSVAGVASDFLDRTIRSSPTLSYISMPQGNQTVVHDVVRDKTVLSVPRALPLSLSERSLIVVDYPNVVTVYPINSPDAPN